MIFKVPGPLFLKRRIDLAALGRQLLDAGIGQHFARAQQRHSGDRLPAAFGSDAGRTRIIGGRVGLKQAGSGHRTTAASLRSPVRPRRRNRIPGADQAVLPGIAVHRALRSFQAGLGFAQLVGDEIAGIGRAVIAALQIGLDKLAGKAIGDPRRHFRIGAFKGNCGHARIARQLCRKITAEHGDSQLARHPGIGPRHRGFDLHSLIKAGASGQAHLLHDAHCQTAAVQNIDLGLEEAIDIIGCVDARRTIFLVFQNAFGLIVDLNAGPGCITRGLEHRRHHRQCQRRTQHQGNQHDVGPHQRNIIADVKTRALALAINVFVRQMIKSNGPLGEGRHILRVGQLIHDCILTGLEVTENIKQRRRNQEVAEGALDGIEAHDDDIAAD